MTDNNTKVAANVITQLKLYGLIAVDESSAEVWIAQGTIKEADWKVLLETQIRNLEKQVDHETD